MVGNMISCDEDASHCAQTSLPAIKLKELPAKDANLFQFCGSVASCQDVFLSCLFCLLFCVNVGLQLSPTCGCRNPIFLHQAAQKAGLGSNSSMGDALWRVSLLQSFHCDTVLLCPKSLQLSFCFCKQSITNPVCQCTNIFLNTWKPCSYKS